MKKTVVVFSGGQDSTTCLIQALEQYDEVHCITFNYGQRHKEEIEVAQRVSQLLGATAHKVLDVSLLNELAISSLTRDNIPVPDFKQSEQSDIPSTFVPGRNILFLTLAAIYAYQIGAESVITGVCETDFSGYPDCRDEFVKALNHAVNLGIASDIQFITPLMWLGKTTRALADYYGKLDFVRHNTLTCYNGIQGDGCGQCAACHLRERGLHGYLQDKNAVMDAMKNKVGLK